MSDDEPRREIAVRTRTEPPDYPASGPIYWCEAVAHTLDRTATYWLGFHSTKTPRLALRWLHARGDNIASQLDPVAAGPIRQWLSDTRTHEQALAALAHGKPYTFAAYDDEVFYILSALPTHTR
jgi:hypothetical protein